MHVCGICQALEGAGAARSVGRLGGLDAELQELSVGEKQLLSLARVLAPAAAGTPLLLLCDEPTASVDAGTDEQVSSVLAALPMTVCTLCHRLHRIRVYDHVLVLAQVRRSSEAC